LAHHIEWPHVGTVTAHDVNTIAGLPRLEDMEFMQFHQRACGNLASWSLKLRRGEGGILRNKTVSAFMGAYAPTVKDLAPARHGSLARYSGDSRGRGFRAPMARATSSRYLTHLDPKIINESARDSGFARTYLGVDPTTEGVPIHDSPLPMGASQPMSMTRIARQQLATSSPALCCGECACVSVKRGECQPSRYGILSSIYRLGRRGGKAITEFLKAGATMHPLPCDTRGVDEIEN